MPAITHLKNRIAIIGAGPAGLMAAEVLAQDGMRVDVYDAMPSVGRKFLMAGKGGMNITHAEPYADFITRYGAGRSNIAPLLNAFTPDDLREWIHGLGIETFVGSSGRVFPTDMKAAPLLRAWLHRLRENGVQFHVRHRWCGWNADGSLCFEITGGESSETSDNPSPPPGSPSSFWPGTRGRAREGVETYSSHHSYPHPSLPPEKGKELLASTNRLIEANPDAVVLALGGGSWPQLGSDAKWVSLLAQRGIDIAPLRPANCGFDIAWSAHFRERFVGEPLKSVAASFAEIRKQGECLITEHGIEGGLIYAFSAALRDEIERNGSVTLHLDLLPDWTLQRVHDEVHHPRGSRSLSSHLQSRLSLKGAKANLLREVLGAKDFNDLTLLASAIKSLPLKLIATRPLSEAISSAGGVKFEALDEHLMLRNMPGVFCAGEMLDWEAPTGGYLLSACFASGRAAGIGVVKWLSN